LSGFLEQAERVVEVDDPGDHRHDDRDELVPTEPSALAKSYPSLLSRSDPGSLT
jgi:hypothetical protein